MLERIGFYLAIAVLAVGMSHLSSLVAKRSPSHVRVIWYLFSLSLVVTTGVGFHARHAGAINDQGMFVGDYGQWLAQFLKIMLDLDADLMYVSAILGVVVIPQFISYVISGFFGCASVPLYAGSSMTFFVWSAIKSFAVGSGILFSIFLMGRLQLFFVNDLTQAFALAILLITLSFGLAWSFEEGKSTIKEINQRWPNLTAPLKKIHAIFTRNQIVKELESSAEKTELGAEITPSGIDVTVRL